MLGGEVVLVDDFRCDVFSVNSHILEYFHERLKEEIFYITCTKACATASVGDNAVDMYFCVGDGDSGRTDVLIRVKFVTADGEAHTIYFCFIGTDRANHVGVGYFSIWGNLKWFDEEYCVGTGDCVGFGAVFG